MTTADEIALLSHIHANPLNNTVRMVLADYLQEQGKDGESIALRLQCEPDEDRHRTDYATWLEASVLMVRCRSIRHVWPSGTTWQPDANCKACKGIGTIPDPVTMARAELIRLQIESVNHRKLFDSGMGGKGQWYERDIELNRCIDAIGDAHDTNFRRGPKCERCCGTGVSPAVMASCALCDGTGDAGGLMLRSMYDDDEHEKGGREDWRHRIEFVRGFPVVHVPLAECIEQQEREFTNGVDFPPRTIPSPWLLSVVKHHPGVSFRVTDREPLPSALATGRFLWFEDDNGRVPENGVPRVLFDLMPEPPVPYTNRSRSHKQFPTADAAHHALGRAMWLWGWLELTKEK